MIITQGDVCVRVRACWNPTYKICIIMYDGLTASSSVRSESNIVRHVYLIQVPHTTLRNRVYDIPTHNMYTHTHTRTRYAHEYTVARQRSEVVSCELHVFTRRTGKPMFFILHWRWHIFYSHTYYDGIMVMSITIIVIFIIVIIVWYFVRLTAVTQDVSSRCFYIIIPWINYRWF